jgi:tungstate transport system ATP-binding protein
VTELYQLSNVKQIYAGRVVLDIPHLTILPGEIFAVVGPSGAGKSTLLRLLNFLEAPTEGAIHFEGQLIPPEASLALLRRVTTVFQRPILLNRSVRENVAYGLHLRSLPVKGRVDEVLQRVGLMGNGRQAAHPRHLSGGELQRAALARALVLDPYVLLLDEPTANLDPYNVGLIESIVRAQNRERGATVVLVTHNVFQARRLADRTALMLEGKIIEAAPAQVFFENPRDPRTAAFVRGEMIY